MKMNLTPIADAIARVFWFWKHQPDSPVLRENPVSRLQLADGVRFGDVLPARCGSCGSAIRYDSVLGTRCPCASMDRTATGCPGDGGKPMCDDTIGTDAQHVGGSDETESDEEIHAVIPNKPKRIRSRHKPLTALDIVIGGVYVPKRGNNKSPNWIVDSISPDGILIAAHRKDDRPEDINSAFTFPGFLALVARRADA